MAHDQHLLWTTKGVKAPSTKDKLDPHSLYDFFSTANAARVRQGQSVQRIKSAAPRIGGRHQDGKDSVFGTPLGSHVSLRNPSPTPATSRPLSSRSGRSSISSMKKNNKPAPSVSPTSLYLGLHKARCKSAPPRPADYYLPQRPKTGKSCMGSASSSTRSAPKRAWQNRTSSAKSHHSLLSREEVQNRHKERCKSAPLPYDFSSIEVVTSVPEHGSDIQRLKAFTRPLTCMPEVVQNVLSHNGLRHCCSAYQPRPKSALCSRQQFWPVARPTVFHRGDVPKYLHFVKPAGYWTRGAELHPRTGHDDNLSALDDQHDVLARTDFPLHGEDEEEETVLYEEQFLIPATPSEASISDREYFPDSRDEELQAEEEDLDATPGDDLADKYLNMGDREQENNLNDHMTPDAVTPEPKVEKQQSDTENAEPAEPAFEIIITKLEPPPDLNPSPEEEQTDNKPDDDLQTVVPEMPQWATNEADDTARVEEENFDDRQERDVVPESSEEPVHVKEEPVKDIEEDQPEPTPNVVEEKSALKETPKKNEDTEPKLQTHQVKFSDSLILTSYKSPPPREEKKEQSPIKPILKPALKTESPPPKVRPVSPKRVTPVRPPLVKPPPTVPVQVAEKAAQIEQKEEEKQPAEEAKMAEEKTEEPTKLEPEVLPKPEYIRAPGAYRMYDPKDLLEYRLEQKRDSFKPVKKSLTSTKMPCFVPSAESTEVMSSIMDEQKQRREGMKPWLQGRLALSQQTSRFELPMDVKLLKEMTPMEYLTKYCIISTRRKALYKHIFQKVDKDRDNLITFKEMDRALKEIHVDYITTEQVKKLIEMVEGNEKSTFNLKQFSAIAAFSERLLFSETQVSEKNNVYSSKEIIEEADFCGLKFKLSGFPVNPTVRKILEVL